MRLSIIAPKKVPAAVGAGESAEGDAPAEDGEQPAAEADAPAEPPTDE
ncbi:MAG TPA: hypothetical protein VHF89_01885 [Solirubrobacteraceae bacterium]|nr:hypothetical protein [Solirubrobacteraceae bacterium]